MKNLQFFFAQNFTITNICFSSFYYSKITIVIIIEKYVPFVRRTNLVLYLILFSGEIVFSSVINTFCNCPEFTTLGIKKRFQFFTARLKNSIFKTTINLLQTNKPLLAAECSTKYLNETIKFFRHDFGRHFISTPAKLWK